MMRMVYITLTLVKKKKKVATVTSGKVDFGATMLPGI